MALYPCLSWDPTKSKPSAEFPEQPPSVGALDLPQLMTSSSAGSSVPKVLKRTMFCKEQFDELKYGGSTYYVLLQGVGLEPKI